MKKSLSVVMALAACLVFSVADIASAETSDSSAFKIDGTIQFRYRADDNSKMAFGADNGTIDGLRTSVILNMNQRLSNQLDLYGRFTYVNVPQILINGFSADEVAKDNGSLDQYGFHYRNAGWDYKLGAQSLSLGATGLLYDDNRYFGKHIFNNALTATGKAGAIDLKTTIAQSNYASDLENDKLYYIHGGYSINKSTYGFGYAHANYGSSTKAKLYAGDGSSLDYYSADFSYKLADNLNISSEFIKSSAKKSNTGENLVLFHTIDAKNNIGAAWFRVEEQAAIQQSSQGNMTGQWGNAQGYGIFFNHQITDNVTVSLCDFKMRKLNTAPQSGMIGDQNTFRADVALKF